MRRNRTAIITLAVLILAIAGMLIAIAIKGGNDKAATDDTQQAVTEEQESDDEITEEEAIRQLREDLTVGDDAEWMDLLRKEDSVRWKMSMPKNGAKRTKKAGFSDAVSYPIKSSGDDKMLDEVLIEACHNQVIAYELTDYFSRVTFKNGDTLADYNPWLTEYLKKFKKGGNHAFETYHTIYWKLYGVELPATTEDWDKFQEKHPGLPYPKIREQNLVTGKNGTKTVFVTEEYRKHVNKLLILVSRFTNLGVQKGWSTNQHCYLNLAAEWNDTRTVWNKDKNYLDTAPVLALAYVRKDGVKEMFFGFNLKDKRIEVFDKYTKTTSTKTPTPAPKKEPDPTPKKTPKKNPTPSKKNDRNPKPDGKDDPKPTKPPKDDPKPSKKPDDPKPSKKPAKDPKDDPVNNGNADTGGGQNDPNNNEDPKDRENQPNQGHQDPGSVKPTNPPAEKPADNTDSNPMDYEPDKGPSGGTTWEDENGNSAHYGGNNNNSGGSNGKPNGEMKPPA